jgi:hypothetical protein
MVRRMARIVTYAYRPKPAPRKKPGKAADIATPAFGSADSCSTVALAACSGWTGIAARFRPCSGRVHWMCLAFCSSGRATVWPRALLADRKQKQSALDRPPIRLERRGAPRSAPRKAAGLQGRTHAPAAGSSPPPREIQSPGVSCPGVQTSGNSRSRGDPITRSSRPRGVEASGGWSLPASGAPQTPARRLTVRCLRQFMSSQSGVLVMTS